MTEIVAQLKQTRRQQLYGFVGQLISFNSILSPLRNVISSTLIMQKQHLHKLGAKQLFDTRQFRLARFLGLTQIKTLIAQYCSRYR